MPTYIPETYKEVVEGILPICNIIIRASEAAETGQRFMTLEASGEAGVIFETAVIPHSMTIGECFEELVKTVNWTSLLVDIPF